MQKERKHILFGGKESTMKLNVAVKAGTEWGHNY